jgi:hypothetical protein
MTLHRVSHPSNEAKPRAMFSCEQEAQASVGEGVLDPPALRPRL